MDERVQLKQIISVLMIFILLIQFTSCESTKIIQLSDIKVSDKYDIHSEKTLYPTFSNGIVSDGLLSGKLFLSKRNYGRENITHIYVSSDSVVQINNDLISIPINSITKIEHQRAYDPGKTLKNVAIFTVIVGITVAAALAGAYYLSYHL
jgi:hypothetical protein